MAQQLRKMGFDAYALKGGLAGWRKAAGEERAKTPTGRTELQPSS